jgi:hypothetical protein
MRLRKQIILTKRNKLLYLQSKKTSILAHLVTFHRKNNLFLHLAARQHNISLKYTKQERLEIH